MSFQPVSNFEIVADCRYTYLLFCFLLDQKEGQIAPQVFFIRITQPFLYLERAPKYILQQH